MYYRNNPEITNFNYRGRDTNILANPHVCESNRINISISNEARNSFNMNRDPNYNKGVNYMNMVYEKFRAEITIFLRNKISTNLFRLNVNTLSHDDYDIPRFVNECSTKYKGFAVTSKKIADKIFQHTRKERLYVDQSSIYYYATTIGNVDIFVDPSLNVDILSINQNNFYNFNVNSEPPAETEMFDNYSLMYSKRIFYNFIMPDNIIYSL